MLLYIGGAVIGIILFIIFFVDFSDEESSKTKSNDNQGLTRQELEQIDKINEVEYLKAKKRAIEILQRFKLRKIVKEIAGTTKEIVLSIENPNSVSDEDIIMEFSKLSDPLTKFETDWVYPAGDALMAKPQSKIDGYIWLLAYVPEYAKMVIPHDEFLKIWSQERIKKIQMEKFIRTHGLEMIWNEINTRFDDFVIVDNITNKRYIDFEKIYDLYREKYEDFIKRTFGVELETPITFMEKLAQEFGYFSLIEMLIDTEIFQVDEKAKMLIPIKDI